jgi:hypothetical protein
MTRFVNRHRELKGLFFHYSAAGRVAAYTVLGGVPTYLERFDLK